MLLPALAAPGIAPGQTGPSAGQYQAYPLRHKTTAEVEPLLADALRPLGNTAHWIADARNNQILLRGPDSAQQVIRQLLGSIDRSVQTAAAPNRTPQSGALASAPTATAPSPVMRTYACLPGKQGETAEQLRAFYADREDVRVAADPQNPQLFVLAPVEVQEAIARQLTAAAVAANPAGPAAAADQRGAAERFIQLQFIRVDQVEAVMGRLLGPRLARSMHPVPGGADYTFADFGGRRMDIRLDRQRNGVAVRGPELLVSQFYRLMASIDSPGQEPGKALRIMPVRKADPSKVEEAVRAYQSGRTRPTPDDSSATQSPAHGSIGLVAYLFQEAPETAAEPTGDKAAVKALSGGEGKEEQTRRLLRAIGSDVEVEMLPDLDVIILRGRERDVEEVSKIVQELERLSAETQPVVEVYPLKHVGGEALTAIVTQVQAIVAGGRQGRVSVIPLVRPNALLLIGWGDAVKAIKEVIDKLDQATAPDLQFHAFPLRHAPVGSARSTVLEFFSGRTGLNGKIQVSADTRTNSLLVQAPPQEMSEVAALIDKLDQGESASVNQTRIFRLKFSLATDLANTLQAAIAVSRSGQTTTSTTASSTAKSASLELLTVDAQGQRVLKSGILADVQITADSRLNTLIVIGPSESMGLIEALIQQLDAPVSAAQVKVFRIVNGDASSMVLMLRGLLPGGGVTSTTTPAQLGVATDEASLVPLRFSVDIRTNSIIAVGSSGELKIVEALLLKLDEEDVQNRRSEVYRLKNSPAHDVAEAINEFLRSKRQVETAAPGFASPFQQIESEVVVVPEPVSNALIISATPRFFEEIHALVEKLDAQPAQVLIQVLIAEVDLNNFDEFGVELGLQDSLLFDRSLLGGLVTSGSTIVDATRNPGFNFNNQTLGNSGYNTPLSSNYANASDVGGQGLSHFNMGRTNSTRGFGGLVLSASSESVSVLLRAMKETHCLDILARPQIMTLDNQPAYIQVGKRVPRIAGTAITAATQVNSIVLENVGLILGVTPRISPEGMVVMELDAEKSKLGPEAEGVPVSVSGGVVIRSPSIDVTTAQTTISAHSGETIVLGGLITLSKEKTDRRVPLLGDIPVIGNLFSYKSNEKLRTELLIILTPHVVRNADDVERVKQVEAARMHWCLADVQAMHGDIGLSPRGDLNQPSAVVYPDTNPRGSLTETPLPAPMPPSPADSKQPAPLEPVPTPAAIPTTPSLPSVPLVPPPPKSSSFVPQPVDNAATRTTRTAPLVASAWNGPARGGVQPSAPSGVSIPFQPVYPASHIEQPADARGGMPATQAIPSDVYTLAPGLTISGPVETGPPTR